MQPLDDTAVMEVSHGDSYSHLGQMESVGLGSGLPSAEPEKSTVEIIPEIREASEMHCSGEGPVQKSPITIGRSDTFGRASSILFDEQQTAGSVRIWVKEAEKAEAVTGLGLKSTHYVYVVKMDSTLPGLVANGMEVRRRFSEFDGLHRMLHAEFRGCFIPPLPQKSFIDHKLANEEFLRLRRSDLQAFLRAIMAHPMLQQSEATRVFMLQPGDLAHNPAWLSLHAAASHRKPVVGPAKASATNSLVSDVSAAAAPTSGNLQQQQGALLGQVGNWMSWVKQNTMAVFQPPHRELPAEEVELREAKEFLEDLERLLQLATTSARSLCLDMERLTGDYYEFGRNVGMLSKFEEAVQSKVGRYTPEGNSANQRAADCKKVAMCNSKLNSIWKASSVKTAANLVTLHDHYIMIPEAIVALEEREAALDHIFVLEEELAHKQHQQEQLQSAGTNGNKVFSLIGKGTGPNANSEKRSTQLSQSISCLSEQIRVERDQYALIKGRNQSELARMGLQREADFRRMMCSLAQTQAQLAQASADLWSSLSKQLAAPAEETDLKQS
ncbi:hypothetical protein CEUSTIGMA_g2834.t1 [Chlamydomonas eustigma]|uniref:PX domain-containing protein n=1 Tax=Chlamydomonas eustigma TaxID=1157962 RepID=A0A250WXY9_9CHLO|nr:hypothetical protein CEUSTIGMA_g2834.t1 [Chlamydomonas eustigma]|eukprot:GAX75390.1 hypothetical protein CEUSTIGMA_g2834.t1 [Chlamydomonas eustigma]